MELKGRVSKASLATTALGMNNFKDGGLHFIHMALMSEYESAILCTNCHDLSVLSWTFSR